MSYKLVNAAFDLNLPRAEKQVLQSLARHARKDGLTWPAVDTVVKETGLSPRGVQDALRSLEAKSLIAAISSKQGGRHSQTVRYRILFPNADMVAALESTWQKTGAVVAPVEVDGCSGCTPTGAVVAPTGAVAAGTGAVTAPKCSNELGFEWGKTPTTTTAEVVAPHQNPAGQVDALKAAYRHHVGMTLTVGKAGHTLAAMLTAYSPAQIDSAVAEWKARRTMPAADIKFPAQILPKELPEWLVWAKDHEQANTVTPAMDAAARARSLEQSGYTEEEWSKAEQDAKYDTAGEEIMKALGLPAQGSDNE